MNQSAQDHGAPADEGFQELIQRHLSLRKITIPLEIRLWDGHTLRFGEQAPTLAVVVKDSKGLNALRRLDELGICEA
ncbi:hypothetical protein [uncultured Thiodictyon sp.]|uniref:hypothetical protein n=1 Tax=uncultured Thiodictyon sp. TaxID=1846217 RepID=UPI0025E03162|nr:hypothetical protein [uncultured Thiodictyon sp.]